MEEFEMGTIKIKNPLLTSADKQQSFSGDNKR
jgi:hypothetical protein